MCRAFEPCCQSVNTQFLREGLSEGPQSVPQEALGPGSAPTSLLQTLRGLSCCSHTPALWGASALPAAFLDIPPSQALSSHTKLPEVTWLSRLNHELLVRKCTFSLSLVVPFFFWFVSEKLTQGQ